MANTIAKTNNIWNITFDGATAWDVTSATLSGLGYALPNGISLKSIQMIPTATDDILTLREGGATGVIIFKGKAADAYDALIKYFSDPNQLHKLYVVGNQATSGVMLIVES